MSDPKTTVLAYTASGSAVLFGGLTVNEWVAIVGGVCAIATFVVNWYYKRKHYKLAESQFRKPFPVLMED